MTKTDSNIIQAPFKGLDLRQLDVQSAAVFHNMDIHPDGSIIRRKGTNFVTTVSTETAVWTHTVKTSASREYLIVVSQVGITITLFTTNATSRRLTALNTFTKANVWKQVLTDCHFTTLTAPYDRVLICTGNHPPVQISLIERSAEFTCVNATTQQHTANYGGNDSNIWRTSEAGSILVNVTGTSSYFTPTVKAYGFDVTVPGLASTLNQKRSLTLIFVSWQWWAESISWYGKDFVQSVSRFNVTAADQNVRIPDALLTDLDPRFNASPFIGLYAFSSSAAPRLGVGYTGPMIAPVGENDYGHGNGGRYIPITNTQLNHSPFFFTFGALQTGGGVGQVWCWRAREVRFNNNKGAQVQHVQVHVDNVVSLNYTAVDLAANDNAIACFKWSFAGGVKTMPFCTSVTDTCNAIGFYVAANTVAYQSRITITNKENRWMGTAAQGIYTFDLNGSFIDGTFIRAYGVGYQWDYDKCQFPLFAVLYRDRLIFRNPDTAPDQLLVSSTSDTFAEGEPYSFYQITDALTGNQDEPFSINLSTKSRDKITALVGWQQSLFVFTDSSCYQVGGEVFSEAGFQQSIISQYGAYNNRCVVVTAFSVLFYNQFGVFDLLQKATTNKAVSEYGSFERSQAIRPLFQEYIPTPTQASSIPFLHLNEQTNKLYVGVPWVLPSLGCARLLVLNMAWDSWSTLSFSCTSDVKSMHLLYGASIGLLTIPVSTGDKYAVLQFEAPHNLDWYVADVLGGTTLLPATFTYPKSAMPVDLLSRPWRLPNPSIPLFKEWSTAAPKQGVKYYGTPAFFDSFIARNYMQDVPELRPFLHPQADGSGSIFVAIAPPNALGTENRAAYLTPTTYTTLPPNNVTLPTIQYLDGGTSNTCAGYGVIYTSIFASPTFNLNSLQNLKRLLRLNICFDLTAPQDTLYTRPGASQVVHQRNGALVFVQSNYQEATDLVDYELYTGDASYDAQQLDGFAALRDRHLMSLPLQGWGADFQFYIVSTGADAFKVWSYELVGTPQPYPKYIRRN